MEEALTREIGNLKDAFGEVDVATGSGGQKLIRIKDVALPKGCSPESTPALLVTQQDQERPQIYVKHEITLPNGKKPRNANPVQVEGEGWVQFSYAIKWDKNLHSLVQFVGAALRRFAKSE